MNAEEALGLLDTLLQGQKLKDVQELVFRYSWQGWTYPKIAEYVGYDTSHIRDVGSRLWRQLSHTLDEVVTKNTVQAVLRRRSHQHSTNLLESPLSSPEQPKNRAIAKHHHWGEAIDVSRFYGRDQELTQLTEWIVGDRCCLIAILGMGGMGKTTLAAKLTQQLAGNGEQKLGAREQGLGARQDSISSLQPLVPSPSLAPSPFEFVIWQSLRNAPSVDQVLAKWLSILSDQQEAVLPTTFEAQLSCLMEHLRMSRCLLVLDNAEAILGDGCDPKPGIGFQVGHYREGYHGYDELLRRIGSEQHQSCLVLTSREKPKTLALLEGKTLPVRSFSLAGLSASEVQNILEAGGCVCDSEAELRDLTARYSGNPLALKIISTTVRELFAGRITSFLEQGAIVFGDISALLDEQFQRLSDLEKQTMYWLAINREWVSFADLQADFFPSLPLSKLLEALQSLERRSFIETAPRSRLEKSTAQFTLQSVAMEYVTEQIIEQVCTELVGGSVINHGSLVEGGTQMTNDTRQRIPQTSFLQTYALIKATAKDYIRDSQINQIVKPILHNLLNAFGSRAAIADQLMQILSKQRYYAPQEPGYTAGNVLNLLCQLQVDLTGYDFSELTLWQADLRNVALHQVNFAQANLAKTVFREMLAIVLTVAFSPDGQLLATGGMDRQVRLWRVADGRNMFICQGHTGWVWSVAFSPDGKTLASGSDDNTIKLWDLDTGYCLHTLTDHSSSIWSVAFSPDGRTIASGSEDHTIKLWDVQTGSCYRTLKGHTNWVRSVAFSPIAPSLYSFGKGEGILASGSDDQTVKLWDLETGQCYQTLNGHTSRVWSVVFSPDGTMLASGSGDQTVKLWDLSTRRCLNTLQGHTNWVRSLAFHPDGSTIASGSEDQTIRLWQVDTGQCQQILRGHANWVRAIAFNPDGNRLASGSGDHTVKLWDTASGQCDKTLHGYTNRVLSVVLSPTGQALISSHDDGTVRVWNLSTGRCCQTLHHANSVACIAIAGDGQTLASGGSDRVIKLWNISRVYPDAIIPSSQDPAEIPSSCLQTLQGHRSRIWSVAFNPEGTLLASGSEDHSIRVWNTHTGQCLQTFQGHTAWVCGIAFSPIPCSCQGVVGEILASASYDGTIKLWNSMTGECLQTLQGHTNWVWSIAFSPDGRAIASGSGDNTAKVWDVHTGQCLQTLHGHTSRIWSVAFSPTGNTLATGSSDQTVKLWDLATGECDRTLGDHDNLVWSVAFSPDGELLVSGSHDETIKLWQTKTGQCMKTLRVERPYQDMNITDVTGLTNAQKATLYSLGALKE